MGLERGETGWRKAQVRLASEVVVGRIRELVGVDLRSLALFRILVAIAVILNLWEIVPDVAAFYSDDGVLPRAHFLEFASPGAASLYLVSGSPIFASVLVAANILAALCLLIGFRARTAAFVCWVLCLSLARRNFLIAQGSDSLLDLMLFWSIFLPIGSAFSVDAAVGPPPNNSKNYLSIATVGVLLQAVYVYFFGALLKTGPEWIEYGSAVYMALHFDVLATGLAHWLRQHTDITYFLTFYVLWLEYLSPLLLFAPIFTSKVRIVALVLLVTMHLAFRALMDIGCFWLVSIASLSLFTPRLVWDWIDRRYWNDRQRRIAIYYDVDCGFCRKVALVLRAFCLPQETRVLPAQDSPEFAELLRQTNSWIVTDWKGAKRLGWNALVFVLRQSLVTWPFAGLAWLAGAFGLGDKIYRFIGANRRRLGGLTSSLQPPAPVRLSVATNTYLAGVVTFCLAWNILQNSGSALAMPEWLTRLGVMQGFTQKWTMFAPAPQGRYVVPVLEGRTRSGRIVDALNLVATPPSHDWPEYAIDAFRTQRWRTYFNRLAIHQSQMETDLYPELVRWSCRRWEDVDKSDALIEINLVLLEGQTLSYQQTKYSERAVGVFPCHPIGRRENGE